MNIRNMTKKQISKVLIASLVIGILGGMFLANMVSSSAADIPKINSTISSSSNNNNYYIYLFIAYIIILFCIFLLDSLLRKYVVKKKY